MPHIFFIHGIDNKVAADRLLKDWRQALAASSGVDLAQRGVTSQMIYWADVLYPEPLAPGIAEANTLIQSSAESEAIADVSRVLARSPDEAAFVAGLAGKFTAVAMRAAVAEQESASPISKVEERVPLPWRLKEPLMARYLRDVHHYLFNVTFSPRPGASYRVQDEIRRRFVAALAARAETTPPYVVVSHSMGTVIAYDCLMRVAECPTVDALMTIGSPLGLDEIQDKLQPGWTRDNGFPYRTLRGPWTNVFDPLDPVAGFAPRLAYDYQHHGRAVIRDIVESNSGWWRHSIEKYLGGPQLRTALLDMLKPRSSRPVEPSDTARSPLRKSEATENESDEFKTPRPADARIFTSDGRRTEQTGSQLLADLAAAIESYHHVEVAEICQNIVLMLCHGQQVFDTEQAKVALSRLRRKRYFKQMKQLGDALIQNGINAMQIRRQYAQGLIDSTQDLTDMGQMTAALCILRGIIVEGKDDSEVAEARGLIGRVHKQNYINAANDGAASQLEELARAIKAYYEVYLVDPKKFTWQGINAVALLARAERDRAPQRGYPGYRQLAKEILADCAVDEKADHWNLATAAEAYVALGQFEMAMELLQKYIRSQEVDAFELSSFLRQLKEVWLFRPENHQQAPILALVQCALMKREGSQMPLQSADMDMRPLLKLEREGQLEKVFGKEGFKSLMWYKTGLSRCSCVARFETKMGNGMGTGFVVDGKDVHESLAGKVLVLTNAHVVSDESGSRPALRSRDAVVTFECRPAGSKRYEVDRIVWSSPPGELDATLVELKPPLKDCEGLGSWVPVKEEQRNVYLIGHPLGGGLSLSLHDSLFLGYRDPRLHYRTPSEPGSSGSPVFDDNWDFIGLHHAGSFQMPRLDGQPGTIEANEGISLLAIQKAISATWRGDMPVRGRAETESPKRGAIRLQAMPAAPLSPVRPPTHDRRSVAIAESPVITYQTVAGMLGISVPRRPESVTGAVVPQNALRLVAEAAHEVVSDPRQRAALTAEFVSALGELERESDAEGPLVLASPRNRMASLLQSVLAEHSQFTAEMALEFPFDKQDTKQALKEVLDLAHKQKLHEQLHPRSATPQAIPDNARIFLTSDFGTGMYGAPVIASTVARFGQTFDLLMHLGDIYYSGQESEVESRFLDIWPTEAAAMSRNLNGNHDMYSGGFGYFDVSLPAFAQEASYFALQNSHWLLVCLDTAYKDNNLGKTQRAWLDDVVRQAGDRKLVLFSHHPLFSNFKEQGDKLAEKLHEVLHSQQISAWYWGHEHHCIIYKRHPLYRFFGRCLGHGGMPYRRKKVADYPIDESFAADFRSGAYQWRKCAGTVIPMAHYLDGPNPYVEEAPDEYGPHGFMTLEFKRASFTESVYDADGRLLYENKLR
ncbi:MAG: trypsin-like peptidase domain-containing protein [Planctomycetes bacterium]|nr:trypsin-like peptidase domain-containing protein [Planctomycetota bacterium]